MTETDLRNTIMIELCKRDCKVFNRPTGLFLPYREPIIINNKRYVEVIGNPININCVGHSDLQGHRTDGKCFYLETKKAGANLNTTHVKQQINFINQMQKSGAIAGIVESVEEAFILVGV